MMHLLRRFDRLLMDLAWPEDAVCLLCGCFTKGEMLCPACRERLESRRYPTPPPPGTTLWSVWAHEGEARRLVHLLKYGNVAAAARVLAAYMADAARTMQLPPDTTVTWVAMPEKRRRDRGIDHGRMLAEAVAERMGLTAVPLLRRSREGRTQRGLTRAQRLHNLSGSFDCGEAAGHILLVDDVTTTGATAQMCTDLLLHAGARAVTVLTATRTPKRNTHENSADRAY